MNKGLAICLFIAGLGAWYAPGHNGIFADAVNSTGEGRIAPADRRSRFPFRRGNLLALAAIQQRQNGLK